MLNGLAWFFYVIGCVMFSLIIVPLKLLGVAYRPFGCLKNSAFNVRKSYKNFLV
ncbi:hypothetical protein ApDm4_1270 [Acetobacter pomorum]|nr:hypothetical protein ApDm4_1270 [Acetobacter pomorum]